MGNILHIAPLLQPLSARAPGGAEQGLLTLAEFQVRLGFDVSVIAAKGSKLPRGVTLVDLNLESEFITPMNTSGGNCISPEGLSILLTKEECVFSQVRSFLATHRNDIAIIHNHSYDFYPLFRLNELGIPIVHSLQLPPLAPWINEAFRSRHFFGNHVSYVSVSTSSAKHYQQETGFHPRVIHYGVDLQKIPFQQQAGAGFIWVGRISPEKGLHTAIDVVCNQLRERLVVIGRVYDERYFQNKIVPHLTHPLLDFRGHQEHTDVVQAMGQARALIFPIEWEEPFGLVVAESLACGTPVVAYRRGALAEIVEDGKTGFLVSSAEEFPQAIAVLRQIDRSACRAVIAQKFSLHGFAAKYLQEYLRLAPRLLPRMRPVATSLSQQLPSPL